TTATVDFSHASLTGDTTGCSTVSLDSTGYSATFDTKAVGTGKTVTVTGLALTNAGTCTLAQPALTDGVITAKTLTVTGVTASNKTYNGNTTASVDASSAVLVSPVGGDDVTLVTAGAAGAFSDKNVATGQ